MSEAHDFREDLLLAWLHDPFDKALTVQGHESRARRYASAALGENVSRRRLRRLAAQADVFAAVAERVPLPTAGPDGLRAVGPEDGLRIVHPCSGAPADLRPCSLDPDRAAAVIGKLVGGLSGPRERFLAIWRLLPDAVAVEFGDDMARLPADTRIPDHTLFQNTDITAGLYASGAQDGKAAFLSFTLGPVQPFIGAARSVRDLWTSPEISPTFVARAPRQCCGGPHGPNERVRAGEGVADTTSKRLEGVRLVTASRSASAAESW